MGDEAIVAVIFLAGVFGTVAYKFRAANITLRRRDRGDAEARIAEADARKWEAMNQQVRPKESET